MFTRKKDKQIIIFVFFSFFLLLSVQAYAAPNVTGVSGDFSNDNRVTITGSGFGTKIKAAPIRFDDCEDGNVGDSVATSGWWKNECGNPSSCSFAKYDDGTYIDPDFEDGTYDDLAIRPLPLLQDSDKHTRHKYSSKHIRWHGLGYKYPPSGYAKGGNFNKENVGFKNTGKALVNFWVFIDYVYGIPEASYGWQTKLFFLERILSHGSPPYYISQLFTNDNVHTTGWTAGTNRTNAYPGSANFPTEGYWVNMMTEYKESDLDVPNGAAHFYVTQTPISDGVYGKKSIVNQITRGGSTTGFMDTIALGYFVTNGGQEANTYWDDIYIDNSWARIEIGDNSVYDNCRHREIQIPITWSGNSIDVQVKQGSFRDVDSVYLFVVDEAGTASTGYGPITFTGSQVSRVPGQPSDLEGTWVR